jgi:hypothetical protein
VFPHLPVPKDRILRSWIKWKKEKRKKEETFQRFDLKNRTLRRSTFSPRQTEEPDLCTCFHSPVILSEDAHDHKATLLCS